MVRIKYVAFYKPDALDGLDWVYNLMENRNDGRLGTHEFYLLEEKNPEIVREKVSDELYKKTIRAGGTEFIIEEAFGGFCGLEYEDAELLEYLGDKDGNTAIEFYKKYTFDSFINGEISFSPSCKEKTLSPEDREKFFKFDKKNLEKLYKSEVWYDILVMPITKELK